MVLVLALLVLIVLFKEARPGEVSQRPPHLPLRQLVRLPHFPLVLGLLLICQFIDRGLALLIPLKVADLSGVGRIAAISGLIISASAVCGTISASLAGRLALRPKTFSRIEMRLDRGDDRLGDLVLHGEHVGEIAVVALGPQMAPGGDVVELRGNALGAETERRL